MLPLYKTRLKYFSHFVKENDMYLQRKFSEEKYWIDVTRWIFSLWLHFVPCYKNMNKVYLCEFVMRLSCLNWMFVIWTFENVKCKGRHEGLKLIECKGVFCEKFLVEFSLFFLLGDLHNLFAQAEDTILCFRWIEIQKRNTFTIYKHLDKTALYRMIETPC